MLEPLQALGIDVFTPGNWEPAYGPERFKDTMARLGCPVVCYNFHDRASGNRLFPPSVTLERQGVKLAIVGVTDIGASQRQPPAHFRGMDTSRIAGLRDFVKELRRREQPDLVVALAHTGLSIARELARETPEFDVILSGHSHERTAVPILEGDVIVVEPGSLGSFLGRLDLVIKPGGGVASHEFQLIPILAGRYDEDAAVKALVDKSLAPYRERMAKQVGRTDTVLMRYDLLESTADDFVADAVREIAKADVGLTNGFRFGAPILPGAITEADLWNLLPMDARMKRGWITGKELRDYLENELEMVYAKIPLKLNGGWGPRAAGMRFVFNARAKHGQRSCRSRSAAARLRRMADTRLPDVNATASPSTWCAGIAARMRCRFCPLSIHEALRQYLRAHPVLAVERDGREIALDLPRTVFSQDAVLAGGDLSKAATTPFGLPRG